MPNDCNNYLKVEGTVEDILNFDNNFKAINMHFGGGSGSFTPSEKELEKYRYWRIKDGLFTYISSMDITDGYSFSNFIPQTMDDFLNGWYGWSVENWGTKWDLYSMYSLYNIDKPLVDLVLESPLKEIDILYEFQTAWSPPIQVASAMARQHPLLKFELSYYEGGMQYAGIIKYYMGEVVSDISTEGDNYKEFTRDHMDFEYESCPTCGALLEDWEFEMDDHVCEEI